MGKLMSKANTGKVLPILPVPARLLEARTEGCVVRQRLRNKTKKKKVTQALGSWQ